MIILALDSSAASSSVALCRDQKLIAEITLNNGNTHSETLLPSVAEVLKLSSLTLDDTDGVAVSVGPGSFTGVRIGAATVKGLFFGSDKPVFEVSSLEGLARNIPKTEKIICPVMNARRDRMYTAFFKYSEGKLLRLTDDDVLPIEEIDRKLCDMGEKAVFVGDGAEYTLKKLTASLSLASATEERYSLASGYSIAMAALDKYETGNYTTAEKLAPVYLRPSEAEQTLMEKQAMKAN